MYLADFLDTKKDEILNEATASLYRSQLKHYGLAGEESNRERLLKLFNLSLLCVKTKTLVPIIEYSEKLAIERYRLGFDFHEVHTAFNVLEEAIWRKIIGRIKTVELGGALSLVSTIFGAGKETLANTYINLAGKLSKPNLDFTALFMQN